MQPSYGCTEVVNIPISFPTAASMLTLDTTKDMASDFGIEFDFKTVRSEAIMLYLSLQDMDRTIEYNFGYIEVRVENVLCGVLLGHSTKPSKIGMFMIINIFK